MRRVTALSQGEAEPGSKALIYWGGSGRTGNPKQVDQMVCNPQSFGASRK